MRMLFGSRPVRKQVFLIAVICVSLSAAIPAGPPVSQAQAGQQPSAQTPAAARPVGTIKSISENTIILTTDAGGDVTVQVQDATKFARIAPGQKDLKDAAPIQLADVHPRDRGLLRGKLADDGKSVVAAYVIAMKKEDIAEKQAREREEWQKHGFGGLVNSVDAANDTITVSRPSLAQKKHTAPPLSNTPNPPPLSPRPS